MKSQKAKTAIENQRESQKGKPKNKVEEREVETMPT